MKTQIKNWITSGVVAGGVLVSSAGADTAHDHPMKQILRAVISGPADLTRALEAGLSVDSADDDGETALMKAADKGQVEAVKALIAAGAAVNAVDEDGETALMKAADEGYTEVVKILIAAGADLSLRDEDGETALMKAVDEHHSDTARVLRDAEKR